MKELKDVDMGADKVAMMVESRGCQLSLQVARGHVEVPNAARNTPTHILPRIITNSFVLGSFAMGTPRTSWSWVPACCSAEPFSVLGRCLTRSGLRSSTAGGVS